MVSALATINKVNLRRAQLVLGWVTVSGFNSRYVIFIPVCDQPSRSTQPRHHRVDSRSEYQPNGGDALRLGVQTRKGSCVGGRQNCVIPLLRTDSVWAVPFLSCVTACCTCSINQSINTFITCHGTKARATVRIMPKQREMS